MPHVIIMPQVSQAGGAILDRNQVLKVLNRLYDQLESQTDRYRSRRDPDDEELFDYVIYLADEDNWHTLRFSVDDRQATDYLFVVAVSHLPGKTSI